MKKLLLILFGLILLVAITTKSYAADVAKWKSPALDVYIENGQYYNDMNKAFYTWVSATNRNILFNVSNTKTMQKCARIKILFNNGTKEGVISNTQSGIYMPVVTININTAKLSAKQLQSKFLHYVGISAGLDKSNNKLSVMYKQPLDGQTILYEDVLNLYKLYGWNIPKKGLYIKPLKSYKK